MRKVGDRKTRVHGAGLLRSRSGQSVLEFAMVIPLAFLLVVNVVNFGALAYACITLSNAARTGASYMAQGPASVNAPSLPSASMIHDKVIEDMGSLPNASQATVTVCSGTASGSPYNCAYPNDPSTGTAYVDPEPSTSIVGTVKVVYTFCPLISGWSFPGLGIQTTLPACTGSGLALTGGTTITRVAAMRIMQ
jgi:Flp pilus assembly protein TadG